MGFTVRFDLLHPADQIVMMMGRIYKGGLTTTLGGNLSILDDNGDIWITPSGVDKGALTRNDICCVKPDATVASRHSPSVELPFHASVYRSRPDLRAVLHAHPPHLVAFSVAHRLPDMNLIPGARHTCGVISMSEYALPGSKALSDGIAAGFEKGADIVIMQNHGVCVGANSLFDAFMKFETLENTAAIEIIAGRLGTPRPVAESEIGLAATQDHLTMDDLIPDGHDPEECAARSDMIALIRRSYRQRLFAGAQCTYSARLSDGSFLITPCGTDCAYLDEPELVLIKNGKNEQGKVPSRYVKLHELIYQIHPQIHSILGASPPHAMAFAVTGEPFDPRAIPESYINLQQVQRASFSEMYLQPDLVANIFSERTSVLICENSQILATGSSPLHAFKRLEAAETTAQSLLEARSLVRRGDGSSVR